MYEFEFYNTVTDEVTVFFGYSVADVKRRNPDVDFSLLECIGRWYID